MMYGDVFNGELLPAAFLEEENIYYYHRYLNGDIEARDNLIKHNLRLVLTVIKRNFCGVNCEIDELFSVGIFGLIKAIDNYDDSKGCKISTYISKSVRYEILHYFRASDKYREFEVISLDEPAIIDGEEAISFGELIAEDTDSMEESVINRESYLTNEEFIRNLLYVLNERDRKIVMLYFGFINDRRYNQREISEMLNISRARVSKVIISSLEKMKKKAIFDIKLGITVKETGFSRKLA